MGLMHSTLVSALESWVPLLSNVYSDVSFVMI